LASAVSVVTVGVPGTPGGVDGIEGPVGAVTVKVLAADVPPPGAGVATVTGTGPWVAMSAAEIVARSWVALTTVVGRAPPFQRTTDVATKPLPFTVSVSPVLPAGVLVGDSVPATGTGAVTEKLTLPDVPPPGAGVETLTGTDPGVARSAAVMAARSRVALTKVVVRSAPFQRTTDPATNPVPFTVSVKAAPPTEALAGDRPVTVGTGLSGRSTRSVSKVAVTAVAALIVQEQVAAVPLQAPLQPAKTEPEVAAAVSVTGVPTGSASPQSLPHEMPAGTLLTVPEPEPVFVTERVKVDAAVPEPLTARDAVSPPAVKFTLPAKLPAVVGRKRTVTVRLAPAASDPLPPEAMLNGDPTLAVTERLVGPVFCTVNVRSTVPLTATLPKFVVAVGVTVKSDAATPVTELEHALSLPAVSTALTRTTYVLPALSAVMRAETVCPDAGELVGDETEWNEPLGHAGVVVPR
jgi:hypothetical protein